MKLITRDELKEMFDGEGDFKLVMTLGTWQYNAKHIPGSIHVDTPEKAHEHLQPNDVIIVYCSNPDCVASQMAYYTLVKNGFKNVRRFAGGLAEWDEAGYPIEGDMVE